MLIKITTLIDNRVTSQLYYKECTSEAVAMVLPGAVRQIVRMSGGGGGGRRRKTACNYCQFVSHMRQLSMAGSHSSDSLLGMTPVVSRAHS